MSKRSTQHGVSNPRYDPATIISELDRWVAIHGNGQYVPADYEPLDPLALFPDYGIQQVCSELHEFVAEIVGRGLSGTALEIGLGYYGSTHFLWRLMFKRVITIEKSPDRCRAFARSYSNFYSGAWPSSDDRSAFILGLSSDPTVVRKTYDAAARQVDLLFIDGGHSYQAVLCDWLLYHKLVRRGGIVTFHDCVTDRSEVSEVPNFLAKLESGAIDGKLYPLRRIVHSRHLGIAFYECT